MLEAALFGRFCAPLEGLDTFFNQCMRESMHREAVLCEYRQLAIVEIDHLAGPREERRCV